MKVTIIGAGKTGRGFLARLIKDEADITFIDSNEELIKKLKNSSFKIDFFSNKWPSITISNFKAYSWDEIKEINADLILVSVGGTNLPAVGNELKKYIKSGQKIIVAENASKPAKKLFDAIGIEGISIAESTVFCTTINGDGLNIQSECYPYLQYNNKSLNNVSLGLKNLKGINNFDDFLDRKLFTYNSAACIIAYLGQLKGFTDFGAAANDPEILSMLDKNYALVNEAMCKKYGYDKEDQKEFALLSRNKFTDRTIIDSVARNGREPQRKITRNERIVGIMMLLNEYQLDTTILEKTLAGALLFTSDSDAEWEEIKKANSYAEILTKYCEIPETNSIFNRVLKYIDNYQLCKGNIKNL